jgi:hypothetical protein
VAPVAIAQLAGEHGVDFGGIFAGAVVTAGVPRVIPLFFQRYFAQSLSRSAAGLMPEVAGSRSATPDTTPSGSTSRRVRSASRTTP